MSAVVVFTTAPSQTIARKLARILLAKRLAVCAHLAPAGESHYWWKGKQEKAREVAMTLKTSKKALPSLIRTLKQTHPYETPEILAIRVDAGHPAYLKWLETEVRR